MASISCSFFFFYVRIINRKRMYTGSKQGRKFFPHDAVDGWVRHDPVRSSPVRSSPMSCCVARTRSGGHKVVRCAPILFFDCRKLGSVVGMNTRLDTASLQQFRACWALLTTAQYRNVSGRIFFSSFFFSRDFQEMSCKLREMYSSWPEDTRRVAVKIRQVSVQIPYRERFRYWLIAV